MDLRGIKSDFESENCGVRIPSGYKKVVFRHRNAAVIGMKFIHGVLIRNLEKDLTPVVLIFFSNDFRQSLL